MCYSVENTYLYWINDVNYIYFKPILFFHVKWYDKQSKPNLENSSNAFL